MNKNQNKKKREQEAKTELAQKIANQSQKVATGYARMEENFLRIFRSFSAFFDKILFNKKYSKLTALILALFMFATVNATSLSSYRTQMTSSKSKVNVAVTANYNSDLFELSGLPATANITFIGDATGVTAANNADGHIVADLEGLTEGAHEVKLKGEGFGDNVDIKIDPSNVTVTLKKKTTQQFDLSYDVVNQDKMDPIYSIGTPEFEYNKINVRASKDTLSSIAFVKALIDVSNQSSDFEQDAKIVAYDQSGQVVKADIVPDTVHVKVPVSSPSKTVSIEVQITGEVPNDKAIASVGMDQESVTIYGPQNVLSSIEKVVVSLDASTITKDSTVLRPITLPTGVSSSSISQVTMSVKLGAKTSKTLDGVKINYQNNTNNYKASQKDNKTTTSVVVYGTQENIDKISADDIYVYVDMKDAKPGTQDFPLLVDQPSNGLIRYELTESTYELNVLGETNDSSSDGANNG